MDDNRFFELDQAIDDCLTEFRDNDDRAKKALLAGGVGVGGVAGYAVARKNTGTRASILRGEVKAENAVRGALGKSKGAARKGLKRAADLPGKAGSAVSNAAKLKITQAGNLAHRARQKAGLGYASPVSRAGRKGAAGAGRVLRKTKGLKGAMVAAARKMRFESVEEFEAYVDKCVDLDARFEGLTGFDEPVKNDYVSRGLLGTRGAAALNAPRGKKLKAYGTMLKHGVKETGKGAAVGAGLGLTAAGLLLGRRKGFKKVGRLLRNKRGLKKVGKVVASGAAIGGIAGSYGGLARGNYGKEASRKYREVTSG